MDTFKHLALLCLMVAGFFFAAEAHTTACNHGNDTTCLYGNATYEGVQMRLQNVQRYWFGEQYAETCPNDKPMTAYCENVAPNFPNIITRMRMSDDNDTSIVEQVLGVHYMAPAGSFRACGTVVEVDKVDKIIDPVHSIRYNTWSLMHRPIVTWKAKVGERYTLVFWDPNHFMLRGMWINIMNDTILGAQEVVPYSGPLSPFNRRSPFVFALYKQPNPDTLIDVQEAYDYVHKLYMMEGHVKLNKIVDHMNLTGPVGVSLIINKYVDEYSTTMTGRNMHLVNNCPYLATKELVNRHDQLRINATELHLSVSVDVTYSSPPFSATVCCQKHMLPSNTRHADSRLKAMVEPVYTRMAPHVHLLPTQLKDEPFYFAHRVFTLVFVDITEKSDTDTNYYLHWQVINIRDPMIQTGETTVDYVGAVVTPSTQYPNRTYAYLLFEQTGELTKALVNSIFTGEDCPKGFAGRCKFNLIKFQTDLHLKLVGASGHMSAPDGWSRHEGYMVFGMAKNAACLGIQGYADPCPDTRPTTPKPCPEQYTGVASLPMPNMAAMLFAVLVFSLFV